MERTTLDDAIVTLTYYYISGASFLLDTMHREVKELCLDKEISPEAKKALKRDLNFTSPMISALGEAKRNYLAMMKAIDFVESNFNTRIAKPKIYDELNAHTMSLISFCLPWLMIANESRDNEEKIMTYLETFPWTEELKKAVVELRKNVAYYRALKK